MANANVDINNVSIFGLGKLGASMVAGMASRGLNVIGVDINEESVRLVNEGKEPVQETGLGDMIAANKSLIRATMDPVEAVAQSDISFVIVPTPSDDRGAFTLQYIRFALRDIGKALKEKQGYHVVVITSTVLPGSTRHGLIPVLEEASGKRCGPDFGVCYSPEFIALGTVIRDFLNPDFYLVGQFDERSGDYLEYVNTRVALNEAPSKRMSIENAEIAKIALNSYVTMKISFANTLADICERVPGGDVDVVSDAIGQDTRVGRKYLTGGLGFGGPCFPRDNVALSFIGRSLGANMELLETNENFNRSLSEHLVTRLKSVIPTGSTVAVLGLAYKPLSHVIEESPGVFMARALSDAGMRVIGYDPLAAQGAKSALQYHALVTENLNEALKDADVVLVATPDDIFRALSIEDIKGGKPSVTVVDCWRVLKDKLEHAEGIDYVPIGQALDTDRMDEILKDLWKDEAA